MEGTRKAIEDILLLRLSHLQQMGATTVETHLAKTQVKKIIGDLKWAWQQEVGTKNYAEDSALPTLSCHIIKSQFIFSTRANP